MNDDEPKPPSDAQRLLQRAAQLDPAAWATPLLSRLQARRNQSYQDAIKEAQRDKSLQRGRV